MNILSLRLRLYQLLLVLVKDFTLQFRQPVLTIIELCIPIISVCLVIAVRHLVPEFQTNKQCFVTFESDPVIIPHIGNYTIYYTPHNDATNNITGIIQSHLPGSCFIGVDDEYHLVENITRENIETRLRGCFYNGAGVVFNNVNGHNMSYTIRLRHETPTKETNDLRWYLNRRFPALTPTGPRVYDTSYMNEGFIHLQHVITQSLIQYKTGTWPDLLPIEVRQFPHISYKDDLFLANVEFMLPFFIMVSFILSVGLFTKELVVEKQTRVRETLKMNGLTNGILWLTWFIKEFVFLSIPAVLFGVLLVVGEIFPYTNIGTLVIVIVVYLVSIICSAFFISVWFDNSHLGMMAGFVFSFFTLIPHFFLSYYNQVHILVKAVSCFFPNTCVGLAVNVIAALELRGDGLQFADFLRPLSSEEPLNVHIIVGMLLLDSFIAILIAWYINEWRPGQYGIPRKFYFPLQLNYWTGKTRVASDRNRIVPFDDDSEEDDEDSYHERQVPEPEISIHLKKLKKKFKTKEFSRVQIHAVNDLNMKVYKGQITALLGHNGAGKTTTMSILTGLFPPTSGSAYINGLNVMEDVDTIRLNLGICPQYNVLFDRLTVVEHLKFFARLKGVSEKKIKESISFILKQLNFEKFKNYKAYQLSGGNKRKLSVAIAFTGDPDVVLLDEPTSGMDHVSQIKTWDLLESKRASDKTIVITTHSLDDTERCDRVLIMVDGKLACSGRPSWLKKRYGVGYNLKVSLNAHGDPDGVQSIMKRHIWDCEPTTIGRDVQVLLPLEKIKCFSSLFKNLEDQQHRLGIVNFNIQENKMENVFIKAGEGFYNGRERKLELQEHPPVHRVIDKPDKTNNFSIPTIIVEEETNIIRGRSNLIPEGGTGNRKVLDKRLNALIQMSSSAVSSREPSLCGEPSQASLEVTSEVTFFNDNSSSTSSVFLNDTAAPTKTTVKSKTDRHIGHKPSSGKLSGIIQWLQQYRATVVKRFLNFMRFPVGVIWQTILPITFLIVGLSLAGGITSNFSSEPSRKLNLIMSAPSNNLSLFQASFINYNPLPFNYEDLNHSLYGNPFMFNYTSHVINIKHNLSTPSNVSDCCRYEHQILDKYCASIEESVLANTCQDSDTFGYQYCLARCLSCCKAREHQTPSCSNPRYQKINDAIPFTEASQYCPTAPKLSIRDYVDPSGPLDDINTFIAEYLLQLQEVDNNFYNGMLGGLTLSRRQPPHSVCGCSNISAGNSDCNAQLYQVDLLNSISHSNCGDDDIPRISLYSDDNLNYLDLSISVQNLSSLLSDISIANSSIDQSHLQCRMAIPPPLPPYYDYCQQSLDLISALPTCRSLSNNQATSVCFDPSCVSSDKINHSHVSAQYNCWSNNADDDIVMTLWYNNQPYHLLPAIFNAVHNLYLRSMSGYADHSITVYNHPLPRHPNSTLQSLGIDLITFSVSSLTTFGFIFLMASFVLFIVQEKSTKAKHLQVSSGLHLTAYWFGNITWDLITCLIPITLSMVVFGVAQIWVENYSGLALLAILLILLFVCWAQIPLAYLVSLPFTDIYTAYATLFLIIFLCSLLSLCMVYVVGNVAGYHEAADIMHYISLINPGYCLCAGLTNLYVNHVIRNTCKASDLSVIVCQILDVSYAEVPFEFFSPGIGYILVYLFIEGIVYFTLTLLADHYQQIKQYFQRKKGLTTQKLHENAITASQLQNRRLSTRADDELATNRLGVPAAVYPGSQVWSIASQEPRIRTVHVKKDNSVKEEKLLVDSLFQKSQFDGYNVVVGRLTKHYNSSFMDRIMTAWRFQPLRQPAVNNMSMLLEETQCFGLLGYNGAGKSTTFKMLTGEISASSGTAVIAGYDVRTHLRQVQKNIGYCPQFDALIERLTGRELLTMFARIKGVSERDISRVVQSHIDTLGLAKHADKQCRKYSGGNRRKLSTGIALLGNPSVIFLDEPTSGMDIKTRQNFIATLNRIMQEERKTIILSSHSISECESLCNKIGIMIGGEFRCIGSTEKLKNLYGERETKVTIRVEHCTYEDLPPYNPLFDDSLIQSETMRSSFLISNSMNQRRSSVTSLMRPPSVYNRVRNVGRLLSISSAINVEEDEPLDEEDDDVCNNPYLQEVCDRMKQHFHKKMDIKKISIENDEVTYKLSRKTVPLSDIFRFMEQLKADQSLHVINYSVNQSTLDQVFVHFIREQEENEKMNENL